jgi:glycerophosphoryl diester phosphodiesterase
VGLSARVSKGSLTWLIVTLLFAGLALGTYIVKPEGTGQERAMLPAFDLQGHRGARGLYPENSLAGFEAALALGVTTLEMDLGMTRDGVLVVHHDRRLDPERTRGPDGAWIEPPGPALIGLELAELQAYDLGRLRPDGKLARRFPEQRGLDGVAMPTLAQVLARTEALSGGTVRYNIETKISPLTPGESPSPARFAEAVVAALGAAGVTGRALVQSFDWRTLQRVQETAPEIATAYLTAERDWLDNLERGRPGVSPWTAGLDVDKFDASIPRLIKHAGGAVWSPFFRDLRAADLAEARGLGLAVVPYTVNDPADMASLIELGVDGIITDYPDRLRRVMAGKGLALPPAFAPAGG